MRKTEENSQISVHFSDADFQDSMRVDPLTGSDEIMAELSRLDKNEKDRQEKAERIEAERKQKRYDVVEKKLDLVEDTEE